jgi:hypothetical protein
MAECGSDGASAYRNSTPVTVDVVSTPCMNTNPVAKKPMLKEWVWCKKEVVASSVNL